MKLVRALSAIAFDILNDWRKPHYAAVPYIRALTGLTAITDYYGQDSAREVVLRFLVNAKTWRGPEAQRIKAELKAILEYKGD